jgi:hypothetical protein
MLMNRLVGSLLKTRWPQKGHQAPARPPEFSHPPKKRPPSRRVPLLFLYEAVPWTPPLLPSSLALLLPGGSSHHQASKCPVVVSCLPVLSRPPSPPSSRLPFRLSSLLSAHRQLQLVIALPALVFFIHQCPPGNLLAAVSQLHKWILVTSRRSLLDNGKVASQK